MLGKSSVVSRRLTTWVVNTHSYNREGSGLWKEMGHGSLGETHGFPNTCEHLHEFYKISKRSLSGSRSASFLFLGLLGNSLLMSFWGDLALTCIYICMQWPIRKSKMWKLDWRVYSFLLVGQTGNGDGNFGWLAKGQNRDRIRIKVLWVPNGSLFTPCAASSLGISLRANNSKAK